MQRDLHGKEVLGYTLYLGVYNNEKNPLHSSSHFLKSVMILLICYPFFSQNIPLIHTVILSMKELSKKVFLTRFTLLSGEN